MSEQTNKPVKTSVLLQRLFKAANLGEFFEKNADHLVTVSFAQYISRLCEELEQVPEQVIKQSAIERTYGHQLFNGTRKPSRDKVIQLIFGLGLDVENAQKLLMIADKSRLYPRIKRDAAILYCIKHHIGIVDTQNMLYDLGEPLLGGD